MTKVTRRQFLKTTFAAGAVVATAPHVIAAGPVPVAEYANWLPLEGQLLSRTQYPELFATIGDVYGKGDGLTTFALPDLRSAIDYSLADTEADVNPEPILVQYRILAKSDPARSHLIVGEIGQFFEKKLPPT